MEAFRLLLEENRQDAAHEWPIGRRFGQHAETEYNPACDMSSVVDVPGEERARMTEQIIVRRDLNDQVYDAIKDRLLERSLGPGAKLSHTTTAPDPPPRFVYPPEPVISRRRGRTEPSTALSCATGSPRHEST